MIIATAIVVATATVTDTVNVCLWQMYPVWYAHAMLVCAGAGVVRPPVKQPMLAAHCTAGCKQHDCLANVCLWQMDSWLVCLCIE